MGLVTKALWKFLNPAFQEPLVYMLRYKLREAANLQGGRPP